MEYSVWRPATKTYDYYETAKVSAAYPTPSLPAKELGLSPERAAWTLPAGAKKVGSGAYPKGMVASPKGLGEEGGGTGVVGIIGFGLAAFGLYKIFGGGRR
jgi:hypothetical protein